MLLPLFLFVYVAQTTRQTRTGATTYGDITGASIGSANFVTGKKYLLVFTANLDGNNDGGDFGIQAVHGSTSFGGSEMVYDPPSGGSAILNKATYTWFTVWTAVSGEGVKLQFRTLNSGHTVGADQITIFAMTLSDYLREKNDWYYNEVVATTAIDTTTWSTTNNAAVTFTPLVAGNDWLVMTSSRIYYCCV